MLLFVVGGGFAGYKLFFETKNGTLVVEVDGDADVRFKNGTVQIYDTKGELKYTLKPGERSKTMPPGPYKVEVAGADGVKLETNEFTMTKNGATVRVSAVPPAAVAQRASAGDDRAAAAWLLKRGAKFGYTNDTGYHKVDGPGAVLPAGPLRLNGFLMDSKSFTNDADLAIFRGLENLDTIVFGGTPFSDAGLEHFIGLPKLEKMYLGKTKVTDAGVKQLSQMKLLTVLQINETGVTDEGLKHLNDLDRLTELTLQNTKVTEAGVKALATALPKCRIEWDGGAFGPMPSPDRMAAEYVLSIGGTVAVNDEQRLIYAPGDLPREAFKLTYTGLVPNKQVPDAGLVAFHGCTNLTLLYLAGTQISDTGLANFKECKKLQALQLTGTLISDSGLALFKDCKDLLAVDLTHTKIGDAGLAHLKELQNLSNLNLAFTLVTDEGLAHLKNCKKLTEIWLTGTKVTDRGLEVFKDCENLRTLRLASTQVSDAGMALMKNWKRLAGVQLTGAKITDAGLVHLKECKNLADVDLRKTKVSAMGIDGLKRALPQCKIEWDGGVIEPMVSPDRKAAEYVLSIGGWVRVNGEERNIKAPGGLPQEPFLLTYANLFDNKKATDAGLAAFQGCTNLIHLDLHGTQISDAGLANFKGCKKLQELYLVGARVTDVGLSLFKDCKDLTTLDLRGTTIGDAGMAHLKDLRNLSAIAFTSVTDEGLVHLKNCKKLTSINCSGRITNRGLEVLKDFENLHTLGLNAHGRG